MRSQPKSLRALTLFSSSIKPGGMAPRPSRFQTTSRSCSFRHAHLNSTAKKISGNSCGRTGCRTEFSNPSTISSTTAATLGTHSSTSPGRSCPSRDATGQQSVTQTEDWYYAFAALLVAAIGAVGTTALLMLVIFAAGFFVIGTQYCMNALAASFYPTRLRSTGVGWALGIGSIGSIVGPVVGGIVL